MRRVRRARHRTIDPIPEHRWEVLWGASPPPSPRQELTEPDSGPDSIHSAETVNSAFEPPTQPATPNYPTPDESGPPVLIGDAEFTEPPTETPSRRRYSHRNERQAPSVTRAREKPSVSRGSCTVCNEPFCDTHPGYVCASCGKAVCPSCSPDAVRQPSPSDPSTTERICLVPWRHWRLPQH